MKRLIAFLLAALLLTGCGATTAEPTLSTEELEELFEQAIAQAGAVEIQPVTVSTVDEFLDAICTGAEITLMPGEYDLATASNYAQESASPWYYWDTIGEKAQLVLTGVKNLTIHGSGKTVTKILTSPRYANVLKLQGCENVLLEGFTAGHTEGGECTGGVVAMDSCQGIHMLDLGLFGCGTVGVRGECCGDILLKDCEIYECSYNGVDFTDTEGLSIQNCSFHDLINYGSAAQVFYLYNCKTVSITDCTVENNRVGELVTASPGAGVELRNTTFSGNRVEDVAFGGLPSGLILDGCTFQDNDMRRWMEIPANILDGNGQIWTEEKLNSWYRQEDLTLPAGERTEVQVDNVDDFLAAIAPDTEIILADGVYNLSTAKDYAGEGTEYYHWQEEFDGFELVITASNLVIRSESGDVTQCTISAEPRYADVLNFYGCDNVALQGITAGHTIEPGYCTGGVLFFDCCTGVLVENCGLYGCGILGIQAVLCNDITVKHCDIYECSYGGIHMTDVIGVTLENNQFRDLGGSKLGFTNCRQVTLDGQTISGDGYMD